MESCGLLLYLSSFIVYIVRGKVSLSEFFINNGNISISLNLTNGEDYVLNGNWGNWPLTGNITLSAQEPTDNTNTNTVIIDNGFSLVFAQGAVIRISNLFFKTPAGELADILGTPNFAVLQGASFYMTNCRFQGIYSSLIYLANSGNVELIKLLFLNNIFQNVLITSIELEGSLKFNEIYFSGCSSNSSIFLLLNITNVEFMFIYMNAFKGINLMKNMNVENIEFDGLYIFNSLFSGGEPVLDFSIMASAKPALHFKKLIIINNTFTESSCFLMVLNNNQLNNSSIPVTQNLSFFEQNSFLSDNNVIRLLGAFNFVYTLISVRGNMLNKGFLEVCQCNEIKIEKSCVYKNNFKQIYKDASFMRLWQGSEISLLEFYFSENAATGYWPIGLWISDSNKILLKLKSSIMSENFNNHEGHIDNTGEWGFLLSLQKNNGQVIITNSEINKNSGLSNSFAYASGYISIALEYCLIKYNFAKTNSFFLSFYGSELLLFNTIVNENLSYENGLIFGGSNLFIYGSLFARNMAKAGPGFANAFSKNITKRNILIAFTEFSNNTSTSGTIILVEFFSLIFNAYGSLFQNNNAVGNGGVFKSNCYGKYNYIINSFNCTFKNNYALKGGVGFYYNLIGFIIFNKCLFQYNLALESGGAISLITESDVYLFTFECYANNNRALSKGGFLDCVLGEFIDNNSTFEMSYAHSGSFMTGSSYSKLELRNTKVLNSLAYHENTMMFSGSCEVTIFFAEIRGNKAVNSCAGISVYSFAKVLIEGTHFKNNSANSGTLIYSSNSNKTIFVSNCLFSNNHAKKNLIYLNSATLILNNITAVSNKANLVFVILAEIQIVSLLFFDNTCDHTMIGCLLSSQSSDRILLRDIFVKNVLADHPLGIIVISRCSVKIKNTTIDNSQGRSIDFLYLEHSSIAVVNVSIIEYIKMAIYSLFSNLTIFEGVFFPFKHGRENNGITAEGSQVKLHGVSFLGNAQSALISRDSLRRNYSHVEVENCAFLNSLNGAIRLLDTNVSIMNSIFLNNIATADGGALYLSCLRIPRDCTCSIEDVYFFNNSASLGGGGAIYWMYLIPVINNVTYFGNSALYGSDISSQATKLEMHNFYEIKQILSTIVSGETLSNLSLTERDFYGNRVSSRISTKIKLSIKPNYANLTDNYEGRINKAHPYLLGQTSESVSEGVAMFENIRIIGLPTSQAFLVIESESIKEYFPPAFTTNDSENHMAGEGGVYQLAIRVDFSRCENGQIYQISRNTCEDCPTGYFSLIHYSDSLCEYCPLFATCPGRDKVILEKGYWRSSLKSAIIYKCLNKFACVGGTNEICREGFGGKLCGNCQKSTPLTNSEGNTNESISSDNQIFFLDIDFKCKSCSSSDRIRAIGIVISIILVASAYTIFMIRDRLSSSHTLSSTLLKLLTDYLQIIGLIANTKVDWEIDLTEVLHAQSSVNNSDSFFVGLDCSLDLFLGNMMNVYFKKILSLAILCLIIPVLLLFFWTILGKLRRYSNKIIKSKIKTSFVIVFFSYQPMFLNTFFSGLTCIEVDGTWLLSKYPQQECWTSSHLNLIFGVLLPFLVSLMFVVPLVFLYLMWKGYIKGCEDIEYTFLTSSYHREYFYWDLINMLQKYILICVTVFLTDEIFIGFLSLLVSFVYLSLQLGLIPYRHKFTNRLATLSRLASLTMVISLLINTSTAEKGYKYLSLVSVFIVNTFFLIYWCKLYLYMTKTAMVCLQKTFFCFKYKRGFYIDEVTGELSYFDRNRNPAIWNTIIDAMGSLADLSRKPFKNKTAPPRKHSFILNPINRRKNSFNKKNEPKN